MNNRKPYLKPQMKKYGSIRQLTLSSGKRGNRENPRGPYPPTTKTGV